ncbi:hypothetical protein E5F05_12005 [Deinococcus metallilatus]|uniref:Uncharacterized protein n=1 Tax=Deinococcus metallilatus TaxID=1211322 RepID=A0AAJ5JXH5_9DEIO|nr:hypothetical protein [Deinococcus metallilatus]MBB5295241.1 hypothetical protein [Deinococcus metallilatus]QBY08597.1 hypothetical protein E5F05_12005 [Deinococcus metallilatus]RXJ10859.1 hypothetical protein ERJ73_10830 [Deinococcus metallilatus]TLK22194.1 hypothetical protein FCS05_18265 [Deinococcus metallilatus]GMA15015.1 hypothetical protein GCM10025871_13460 [Deinococcus metallilatus]
MGQRSVVYGYINARSNADIEVNLQALARFPFDELYPFRNNFWVESAPKYQYPSIFFGGTYKEIEGDWPIWLWKFTQLLSTLEATEANVTLDCWLGRFSWRLEPRWLVEGGSVGDLDTMTGQQWIIVEAPENESELEDLYDEDRTLSVERRQQRT